MKGMLHAKQTHILSLLENIIQKAQYEVLQYSRVMQDLEQQREIIEKPKLMKG